MVRIGFHTPQIDVRGSCTALYDYAHYNEVLYGNTSVVLMPEYGLPPSDAVALEKFRSRFYVKTYGSEGLDEAAESEGLDMVYFIKYGKNDGICCKTIPSAIHCVFDLSEPHGQVYVAVSRALAVKYGKGDDYVPHMIALKPDRSENLRESLGIPEDAVVIGRHGGMDTFNLAFAMQVITEVVQAREDIYFLFANTPKFFDHPRIIHIEKFGTDREKNRFLATCDAGLEAGTMGHTSGYALAEMSIHNRPNIVFHSPNLWNTAHLDMLGDTALYFHDEVEFRSILINFNREEMQKRDWVAYGDYTPEKVMVHFKEKIIDVCVQ